MNGIIRELIMTRAHDFIQKKTAGHKSLDPPNTNISQTEFYIFLQALVVEINEKLADRFIERNMEVKA